MKSESREPEESVRQAEVHAAEVLETIADPIVTFDRQYRFTYVTRRAAQALGKSPDEMVGKTVWEVFNDDIDTGFHEACQRAWRENQPVSICHYSNAFGGWIESYICPFENGASTQWRNIRDRKQMDDALRESEDRFRRLMEVSAQVVWIANAQGERELDSPWWFTGRTTSQPMRCNWLDTVHPEDRQRVAHAWQRAVKTATRYQVEYRQVHTTGASRQVLSQAAPVFNSDGTVREWIGMNTDIADQKRTEQELAQAIQRLDAHMDNSPLAVIEFDAHLVVTRWSDEATRVFGWTASENLGRFMYDIPWVHEDDTLAVHQVSQGMLDCTRPRNVSKNRNYRKDGSVIDCEWYNSAIYDEQGNLTSILSLVLDVTDRKRAEEHMRQVQKLESIGVLAGGVAHDFNNILTIIMGSAGSARAECPTCEQSQAILAASERAAHLTKQLLAYAGKGQVVVKLVDVSEIVSRSASLFSAAVPKRVNLNLNLSKGLPFIEADPSRIEQIVMNLVINAGEAIPAKTDGRIEIKTSTCEVTPDVARKHSLSPDTATNTYVCLEVRDNGSGMDAATVSRIFDPFFSTKFTGRGLGLAAVHGIVRTSGGFIDVRSSVGGGSTFRVFLPASVRESPTQVVQNIAPHKICSSSTILVVDDEEMVRKLACMMLRRFGYVVLEAKDGRDALQVLATCRSLPAVALLDVAMPVLGGDELIPILAKRYPGMKIIISSGYAEEEARKTVSPGAIAGFLQKPYTEVDLAEKIAEVVGIPASKP